jgi:hypothetical protein
LAQGQPQTIVDVLHGRAFRFYSEGIRQYLAIRTGSTDRADHYLAKLRAFVAKTDSNDLIQTPGVRARLYRATRGYLHNQSRPHDPPTTSADCVYAFGVAQVGRTQAEDGIGASNPRAARTTPPSA